MITFSCIIPAKDANDPKLADLISSIKAQDFPQDQIEIIVVTDGDSESAKAIGIRRAKGEICAMFCADNYIRNKYTFAIVNSNLRTRFACYSRHYDYVKTDNSLNRYFSLMGNNDPIAFYLNKADRLPWYEYKDHIVEEIINHEKFIPSLGDNGFFIRRDIFDKADLDHYYPMDACLDIIKTGPCVMLRSNDFSIWHRTSDNLISFLKKRYEYAKKLYCDRTDRRWRIIDTRQDYYRLAWFIISTCTILPALIVSARGYRKVRDAAWFLHWPVCAGFLITYTILAIRNLIKHGALFQKPASLSQHSAAALN